MLHLAARRHSTIRIALCFGLLLGALSVLRAQTTPTFSQFIVFGDSLSDTGNDGHVSNHDFNVTFPGETFNYTTDRFTNGKDTSPASEVFGGVWHEQLAKRFLNIPAATNSLDGGTDYAYGGATTADGTQDLGGSGVFANVPVTLTINNMGQQVSDYLNNNSTDPNALYIVWGGANDLFNDGADANGVAAADRETALIERLARAGAASIMVPNLPPLGATPDYNKSADSDRITQSAADFCNTLTNDLNNLEARLSADGLHVKIYRLDVWNLFTRLLANQYAYGFTNITSEAQGSGVKADEYLFWDGVHPTVAGHYQLAAEAYTLLTGIPIVQIHHLPAGTPNGRHALSLFYVTRTGSDFSADLMVPYTTGGTAMPGTNYSPLTGIKELKPGKQTAKLAVREGTVPPTKPAKIIAVTIQPGAGYQTSVVTTDQVKLLPTPSPTP